MGKHFFDYDDCDYVHSISDNMAIDSDGNMMLFDGLSGELCDAINLGSNIEATPSAFENTVVVGTRGQRICLVKVE